MKTSIKATILATILATGAGGATCGGFTQLKWPGNEITITNCQYTTLREKMLAKYPLGNKEVINIDDWQLLVAIIDKEIQKKGTMGIFEKFIKK